MAKAGTGFNRGIMCGLAGLLLSFSVSGSALAQHRDRDRDARTAPSETRRSVDRDKTGDRSAPGGREAQRQGRSPSVQPAAPRARTDTVRRAPSRPQIYTRPAERDWQKSQPVPQRQVYVPRRWVHAERPHYRSLWQKHYGRVWWCDFDCRISFLFGFTIWTVHTVLTSGSVYSFPAWETLEYNRTGQASLWESSWGYVEFTPVRTFRQRFGRHFRNCRDFLRVVVRSDGVSVSYHGTACRNPDGAWWIIS